MPQQFQFKNSIPNRSHSAIQVSGDLSNGDNIYLTDRTALVLGNSISKGGEGVIFEIIGRTDLAKLYFQKKLTSTARDKVKLLETRKVVFPGICWPSKSIMDSNSAFRGFIMPRARGKPLDLTLFRPRVFQTQYPNWTRRNSVQFAIKLLEQIQYLHSIGVLLGDVSPANVLLYDENSPYIVDCDSVQVEDFPSAVGTRDLIPPELDGDFSKILRTMEHELFSVASLLFAILIPGIWPFNHSEGGDGRANIKKGIFPYTDYARARRVKAPPGIRPSWEHLSPQLQSLFASTFCPKEKKPNRPSTTKWLIALRDYQQILEDSTQVFTGPKPVKFGYDLQIIPESTRYDLSDPTRNKLPKASAPTDYEQELTKLAKALGASIKPAATAVRQPIPQPVPTAPALPQQQPSKKTPSLILELFVFGSLLLFVLYIIGVVSQSAEASKKARERAQQVELEKAFEKAGAFETPSINSVHDFHYQCAGFTIDNPIVAAAVTEPTANSVLSYVILCNIFGKDSPYPSPSHYQLLLEKRQSIPEVFRNQTQQVQHQLLSTWGIDFTKTSGTNVLVHYESVDRLKHLFETFKKSAPINYAPVFKPFFGNTNKVPSPKLPFRCKFLEEVGAIIDPTVAGKFALQKKLASQTAVSSTNMEKMLADFATYYVPPNSLDYPRMRNYQSEVLFEHFEFAYRNKVPKPSSQIYVDLLGNIVAPKALHEAIQKIIGSSDGGNATKEKKNGVYSLALEFQSAMLSKKFPRVIDTIPYQIRSDSAHYDHVGLVGSCPASLIAYWIRRNETRLTYDPANYKLFCSQAASVLKQSEQSLDKGFPERQRQRRAQALKEYGITETTDGKLEVIEKNLGAFKAIVAVVFGDTIAEQRLIKAKVK